MVHVLYFGIATLTLSTAGGMLLFALLMIKDRGPPNEIGSGLYMIALMVLLVGGASLMLNEVIAIFF
jgi:peptidoglycan/LPS O-acetylase OafA/YrhL